MSAVVLGLQFRCEARLHMGHLDTALRRHQHNRSCRSHPPTTTTWVVLVTNLVKLKHDSGCLIRMAGFTPENTVRSAPQS